MRHAQDLSAICFMVLVDTHCHLYSTEFGTENQEIINRARAVGIEKFYLPAIDSEVIASMLSLEAANPGVCYAMMGLHPCSVNEKVEHELAIVQEWLNKRSFVAIGEIGLDFYWDKTFANRTKKSICFTDGLGIRAENADCDSYP